MLRHVHRLGRAPIRGTQTVSPVLPPQAAYQPVIRYARGKLRKSRHSNEVGNLIRRNHGHQCHQSIPSPPGFPARGQNLRPMPKLDVPTRRRRTQSLIRRRGIRTPRNHQQKHTNDRGNRLPHAHLHPSILRKKSPTGDLLREIPCDTTFPHVPPHTNSSSGYACGDSSDINSTNFQTPVDGLLRCSSPAVPLRVFALPTASASPATKSENRRADLS